MSSRWGTLDTVPEGQQRAKVPCMNGCTGKGSTSIRTWAKGEKKPRVLCPSCQGGNWEGKMMITRNHAPKALDPAVWLGDPVTIYRPGDEGFAERAAQCTFIQDIANVSPAAKFCFALEAKQRIIRREKREAEIVNA